jgi:heat shock protein HslJ
VTQRFELGLNAVTPGGLPLPADLGGGTGAGEQDETPPLAGTSWVWVNTEMGDDSVIAPEDPAAFTLIFNEDGSFSSTTDCNSVFGQFTADDATGQLSFGQMASTLMACPGTLEGTYTGQLAGAASYLVRDGQLYIALQFDSGIMEFAPAGTEGGVAAGAEGESAAGGAGAAEGGQPELAGTQWTWVETQMSDDTLIAPTDPARFVLTFDAEGGFATTTDCNTFRGNYTADAASGLLSMETTVSTRMGCPPEALEDEFVRDLNNAASYLVQDGNLFIAGAMDSGIMEFTPVK